MRGFVRRPGWKRGGLGEGTLVSKAGKKEGEERGGEEVKSSRENKNPMVSIPIIQYIFSLLHLVIKQYTGRAISARKEANHRSSPLLAKRSSYALNTAAHYHATWGSTFDAAMVR